MSRKSRDCDAPLSVTLRPKKKLEIFLKTCSCSALLSATAPLDKAIFGVGLRKAIGARETREHPRAKREDAVPCIREWLLQRCPTFLLYPSTCFHIDPRIKSRQSPILFFQSTSTQSPHERRYAFTFIQTNPRLTKSSYWAHKQNRPKDCHERMSFAFSLQRFS